LRTGLVPHPRGRIGLETAVEHLATFFSKTNLPFGQQERWGRS